MKGKRFFGLTPLIVALALFGIVTVGATFLFNRPLFVVEAIVGVLLLGYALWHILHLRYYIARAVQQLSLSLRHGDKEALASFPLPAAVVTPEGEVLWYNQRFKQEVAGGANLYGERASIITGNVPMAEWQKKTVFDVSYRGARYTVYVNALNARDTNLWVLYYIDDTGLKEIAEEYALSRPAVLLIQIDSVDDLMKGIRDSERAQLVGRIEALLEEWAGSTTGVLHRYSAERFSLILEHRHLQKILVSRFDILDRVRALPQPGGNSAMTLSIGVGEEPTLRAGEQAARQALDMALGRGGDQAAVKTAEGFDFYGGVSKSVEKRTKVRMRILASALKDLILSSDAVLITGHRFSDLDSIGSGAALAAAARKLGKPAFVVLQSGKTLARELIQRYADEGRSDVFREPAAAMPLLMPNTLVIVTDTHNPTMLDCPALYQNAQKIVVIDHHRKMVDHIDNTVLFCHEPAASSTSEMVAEMLPYLTDEPVPRLDAEALLAGIMLDTRHFVVKAGVRTFEAAAYLRTLGADTVEVKRLFSGSIELTRTKAAIVAAAVPYKNTMIAESDGYTEVRIAAAQAADELLSIKGVAASFVLYPEDGGVNISARSLGDFNVQLIMEDLGGGGHLTMAGAYLKDQSVTIAREWLNRAIDNYEKRIKQ